MRFRKKPVVIEAVPVQDVIDRRDRLAAWLELPEWVQRGARDGKLSVYADSIRIETLEGDVWGVPGDWLIRGVEGEIYPCKDSIFQATYEPVDG